VWFVRRVPQQKRRWLEAVFRQRQLAGRRWDSEVAVW
jgi:hypothetical protein